MEAQRIEKQVECPVCLERYKAPKVMPCQHTFCLRCLQQLPQSSNSRVIKCPECRCEHTVPTNGVAGFSNSIAIQRLLEAIGPQNVSISNPREEINLQQPDEVSVEDQRDMRVENQQNRDVFERDENERRNETRRDDNIQEEDLELQMVLEVSVQDTIQEVQQTRNVIPEHDRRTGNSNRQDVNVYIIDGRRGPEIQHNETANTNNESYRRRLNRCGFVVFKNVRKYIRSVVVRISKSNTKLLSAFIIAFSIITFGRFVAGAVKLTSKCVPERSVAVYLFVKACVAAVFWGVICVWNFKRILGKALDNRFVEVYLLVESLFSICWLFVGTTVIFRDFYSINNQCPDYIQNWDEAFINFALFLTVLDYIGLVLFLFYSGYTMCDKRNSSDEAGRED